MTIFFYFHKFYLDLFQICLFQFVMGSLWFSCSFNYLKHFYLKSLLDFLTISVSYDQAFFHVVYNFYCEFTLPGYFFFSWMAGNCVSLTTEDFVFISCWCSRNFTSLGSVLHLIYTLEESPVAYIHVVKIIAHSLCKLVQFFHFLQETFCPHVAQERKMHLDHFPVLVGRIVLVLPLKGFGFI